MNRKRLRHVFLFCFSILFFSFLPIQTFATNQSSNKSELTIRQVCRNDANKITIELQNHTDKEIPFDFKRVSDGKVFGEEGAVGPQQKFESPLPSKGEGEKWIVHTLTKDYPITIGSLPMCLPTPIEPPTIPPPEKRELTIRQICRNDTTKITIELQNHTKKEIAFDFKRVSDGKVFGEEGVVGPQQKFESFLPSKAEGEKWIVHTLTKDYPITIESLPMCLPTPVTPPKVPTKKQALEVTQVCRVDKSTIALRIKNNSKEKISFTFKRVSDGEIFGQEPGAVSADKKVMTPLPSTKTGEKWIIQTIDQDYPLTIKNLPMCKGGKLPTTANQHLTMIAYGGSMIILGCGLFLYRRFE
jgi:hypothetical protein